MAEEGVFTRTGRRKTSIARVRVLPGSGDVVINQKALAEYFNRENHRAMVTQPLVVTNTFEKFNVVASVEGGGITGQAGALRHAVARALVTMDPEFKAALKKAGLLTRDPRMKERKKYGQKGARKRFQYSKR